MLDSQSSPDDLLKKAQIEFGRLLGVENPIEVDVLRAAVSDASFAQNLLISRRAPAIRDSLLSNPPRPREEPATMSVAELALSAAAALTRWAKVGFTTVEDTVFRARLDACAACPNLQGRPEDHRRLLYRMIGSDLRATCGKCGCPVVSKARKSSEHCPDAAPDDRSRTRWGDPVR